MVADRPLSPRPGLDGLKLERAFALHQQGKAAEARAAYLDLLRSNPNDPRVLHLLGLLVARMGQPARGQELIGQALRIDPRRMLAHRDLGNLLLQSGQFAHALASYDRALALKPGQADILDNRGTALRMMNRLEEALESHDRALSANPDLVSAHLNRGSALAGLDLLAEALESFDQAIARDPASAVAHSNRGGALHKLGRFQEALDSHDKAVALAPELAHAHVSRAQTLGELERYDQALSAYERALALHPQSAEAQFGQATSLLVTGRFREGWQAYEGRRRRVGVDAFHPQGRPQWTGREDISSKVLFIEAEQGLGDMIQFCRYAPLCADRGAHVILTAPQRLLRLLQSLDPRIELRPQGTPPASFDWHIPLMSLPRAFDAGEAGFAVRTPYLRAEPERVKKWRNRIGADGLKIGICWQGGPGNPARSFCLAELAGIGRRDGIRLISLQTGPGQEQLRQAPVLVESLGKEFDSGSDGFLDAAAAMETLDLVVSCDTAMAHLAGALGRPVLVTLKFAADWRYLSGRDDCPWYPTMRLFRQERPGDWQSAFAKLGAALAAMS